MNIESISSIVSRLFFLTSFVLVSAAVTEWTVNLLGYTLFRQWAYTAGRLLEFAAILLVFVIALLLREVRDELRKSRASR